MTTFAVKLPLNTCFAIPAIPRSKRASTGLARCAYSRERFRRVLTASGATGQGGRRLVGDYRKALPVPQDEFALNQNPRRLSVLTPKAVWPTLTDSTRRSALGAEHGGPINVHLPQSWSNWSRRRYNRAATTPRAKWFVKRYGLWSSATTSGRFNFENFAIAWTEP